MIDTNHGDLIGIMGGTESYITCADIKIKTIKGLEEKIEELERHIRILANPYNGEKW
jgi:hypothetical protein